MPSGPASDPGLYRRALQALLPPGPAWTRAIGSVMSKLVSGLSREFARVHDRADVLMAEANPLCTVEMLTDWERVAGLPDKCAGMAETTAERRAALIAKLNTLGGQSPDYFVTLAAAFGYDITITEYRPFKAGMSRAGDALTNDEWAHAWSVAGGLSPVSVFVAGLGSAGDPLRSWGDDQLICIINQWRPAHTIVLFDFSAGFES